MHFCINARELRKALKEIEHAEQNGFKYCEAIFYLSSVSKKLGECRAKYNGDIIEKAHPTDGNLDWGRFQNITHRYKFENGNLTPIKVDTIVDKCDK